MILPHESEGLVLTGGVYPQGASVEVLERGYSYDENFSNGHILPMLRASVHAFELMETFQSLIDSMRAKHVKVYLQGTHDKKISTYIRSEIETLLLQSFLSQNRDEITQAGNLSVYVSKKEGSATRYAEVQLLDDKTLKTYNRRKYFERVLRKKGVKNNPYLIQMDQVPHVHVPHEDCSRFVERLANALQAENLYPTE